MEGHENMIRLLIASGADLNAQADNGMTILHEAVIDNKVGLVELALMAGVDPTIKDRYGNTALQWAERIDRSRDEAVLRVIALLKEYERRHE